MKKVFIFITLLFACLSITGCKKIKFDESKKILVGADDKDEIEIKIKKEICAPIKKGTVIGEIVYRVNGERIISYEVVAGKTVKERTLWICAEYLRRKFLL